MQKNKAFTLIELLVVISIISILAAILFPVFTQAKASAKNTQDLSNIKQVGTSLILYTNDFDDVFVPVGSWNDPGITPYTNPTEPVPGRSWNGWALKLSQYAKNKQVFRSPFMPTKATWWVGACATSNGMDITSTYSYNWYLGADDSYIDTTPGVYYNQTPSGTKFDHPLSSTSVESPSNTLAFMMSQTTSPYGNEFGCDYNTLESPDWDNKIRFRAIYRDGGNIAFADGHAKALVAQQADSASPKYPNCQGGPSHTIYIWASRNIWTYPFYPGSTGGLTTEPVAEACAQ